MSEHIVTLILLSLLFGFGVFVGRCWQVMVDLADLERDHAEIDEEARSDQTEPWYPTAPDKGPPLTRKNGEPT